MRRDAAISDLRSAINRHHSSKLSVLQVAQWVGSDSDAGLIRHYCAEVNQSKGKEGVNPDDVLSLCDDEAA